MTSKRCFSCACEKPLDGFYKHQAMADGRLNKCIDCVKAYQSERRRQGKANEYERVRASLPQRAEARKVYAKTEAGRLARLRAQKKARAIHPDKQRARDEVAYALRTGRLTRQPCEVCGAEQVHGHHDDYSKPLDVRWLCTAHHNEHHRNERSVA